MPLTSTLTFRIIAASGVILSAVLFVLLFQWESAKSTDALRLQKLAAAQNALHLFATRHGAYPLVSRKIPLGDLCLNERGFSRWTSDECRKTPYPALGWASRKVGDLFLYESSPDQKSYRIYFLLETGIAGVPKGEHSIGPDGIIQ